VDQILFPDKKPSRRGADDASGDLWPVDKKAPAPKSKLPLPTFKVPKGTQGKACGCGASFYLVEQPSGKWMPINCGVPGGVLPSAEADGIGISHFIDCPQRDSFRRRR
jgi:hypothetical protein